jgi:hypothetical protein
VITGDLAHHPIELFQPDWAMTSDHDVAAASATRRTFAERYGDGEALIFGTHFGGSSVGRLSVSRRTWTPV